MNELKQKALVGSGGVGVVTFLLCMIGGVHWGGALAWGLVLAGVCVVAALQVLSLIATSDVLDDIFPPEKFPIEDPDSAEGSVLMAFVLDDANQRLAMVGGGAFGLVFLLSVAGGVHWGGALAWGALCCAIAVLGALQAPRITER